MSNPEVKKPFVPPPGPPPAPKSSSPAMGAGEPRAMRLNGHVGFASLPQQLVHHVMSMGFSFNLMCVGETGIGKTTLIESLFNMKLDFEPCNSELPTVQLRSKSFDLEEGGVHLKLTVVETAGFGDQLDKDKSAQVIVDYINSQYESYLQEELKIKREMALFPDTRIHACLYFISPTGHGCVKTQRQSLKAIDVVAMRELSKRVNVIPVIAKADTTSKDELQRFKNKIISELKSHKIEVYRFPVDDETVANLNSQLNSSVPFAVVGSTDFVSRNGKKVRARNYPWGIVEVENEEHCDFVKLREAMLRVNVEHLRDKTHRVLYETFRRDRLQQLGVGDGGTGPKMVQLLAEKRKQLQNDMEKTEADVKDLFRDRVIRKEEELKHRDEEITRKYGEQVRALQSELAAVNAEAERVDAEKKQMEMRIQQLVEGGKRKK